MTVPVPSVGIVVRNARLAVKNELKKKAPFESTHR